MTPPIPGCSGANPPPFAAARRRRDCAGWWAAGDDVFGRPRCSGGRFHSGFRRRGLVFTGDPMVSPIPRINIIKINNLYIFVVYPALSDGESDLIVAAQPLRSGRLAEELSRLRLDPPIYVTHFKPRDAEIIIEQFAVRRPGRRARKLEQNQLIV